MVLRLEIPCRVFITVEGNDAHLEGLTGFHRLAVLGVNALKESGHGPFNFLEVSALLDRHDGGVLIPMHREARLREIGLGIIFGLLKQLEALGFQIHFVDVAFGPIEIDYNLRLA